MRKLRFGRRHPVVVVRHRMSWPRRIVAALAVALVVAAAGTLGTATLHWVLAIPVVPAEVPVHGPSDGSDRLVGHDESGTERTGKERADGKHR